MSMFPVQNYGQDLLQGAATTMNILGGMRKQDREDQEFALAKKKAATDEAWTQEVQGQTRKKWTDEKALKDAITTHADQLYSSYESPETDDELTGLYKLAKTGDKEAYNQLVNYERTTTDRESKTEKAAAELEKTKAETEKLLRKEKPAMEYGIHSDQSGTYKINKQTGVTERVGLGNYKTTDEGARDRRDTKKQLETDKKTTRQSLVLTMKNLEERAAELNKRARENPEDATLKDDLATYQKDLNDYKVASENWRTEYGVPFVGNKQQGMAPRQQQAPQQQVKPQQTAGRASVQGGRITVTF